MSIAIVILNFNGKDFLAKFLPKVIETSPEGTIYVADNGSTDDSIEFLQTHFPEINRIAWSENLGYAGGYTHSLGQIEADFYVLMNSDIEPRAHWLGALLAYFNQHPEVAAVQPFLLDYQKPDYFEYAGAAGGFWDIHGYPFCRGRIFDQVEKNEGQYQTAKVNWATGACLMVRSKAYWEVGGLDVDFFAHMEEIDLCWRLQRAGHQIAAVAESQVVHVGGGTLALGNPFKTYLNFRNNLILLYKNLAPDKKLGILFLRMILDGVAGMKFAAAGEFRQLVAILKAHRDFYAYVIFKANKENLAPALQKKYINSYPKSILLDFFLKKKKGFREITF
jgi:GT2 family glycosyltransferase